MYADVIVDIASSELDKIFEYYYDGADLSVGDRVSVPFGTKKTDGVVINVKNNSVYDKNKIKPIICKLDEVPALTEESVALSEYIVKRFFVTRATALRLFLPSEMRKGKVKEKTVRYCNLNTDNPEKAVGELRKSAVKQKQALEYLAEVKKEKSSILNEKFGSSAINALIKAGFVSVTEEKDVRKPYESLQSEEKNISLTPDQLVVIKSVKETQKEVTLLHGVTGSGKTEVYLNLIKSVLSEGKTAIMLVPEISLTPQMLRQLRTRFGDACAIMHSGLTAGERFDEWWRMRSGEAKIAIGARSAIFAPLENLGLIIIDEEHDGSYKSESAPRYETLEVAKFRAKYNGAKILLGSATPSVETYLKAKNGEYNFTELTERVNGKSLPKIEIADMRREVRRGNNSPFSSALKEELKNTLESGNQAIIFLNQRGYSKTVICTECGYVPKCESCDVSLTYHMEDNALKCHYCNAKYKMFGVCPNCGSKFIRYGGAGTQRVVVELKKLFPSARILRMDRDTTQTKEGHFKILNEFSERKADILVGTQMIAKGHDFPAVTLVGILDADMSLHFSDYRSGERTFQLLTQVAGRSGRAGSQGKVVLQTYQPENNVLAYAVAYDYKGFFENEISLRKATGFPPFADIIRVLVSGENDDATKALLKVVYDEVNEVFKKHRESFIFFGCMKAPIKRLQNKFRYQILMRSSLHSLFDEISEICLKYKNKNVRLDVEVNPNNLT